MSDTNRPRIAGRPQGAEASGTSGPPRAGGRVAGPGFVLGLVAAVIAVAYTLFWTVQLLTLEGGERVIMLNTLIGFPVVGLVWTALAVASLVFVQRKRAVWSSAGIPALVAFACMGLCVLLAVVTATL